MNRNADICDLYIDRSRNNLFVTHILVGSMQKPRKPAIQRFAGLSRPQNSRESAARR